MTLFKEKPLSQLFDEARRRTEASVRYQAENEFSSFPKEKLVEIFMRDEKINHLEINLDERTSSVDMIPIPAENFRNTFDVTRGEKYPCARIKYSYNKPKKFNLLNFLPKGIAFNKNVEFNVTSDKLNIYYQTRYMNENLSEEVKREVKSFMIELHEEIKELVKIMNQQIDVFNDELKNEVGIWIDNRIAKKEKSDNQNSDLNDF